MDKIALIEKAIEDAIKHKSKMDETAWSVPALSSLKIRHLMNNLGAIATRYFECGVHKGGLFCSTVRHNNNLIAAIANDNFASDLPQDAEQVMPQFYQNAKKCLPNIIDFGLLHKDTFNVDAESLYKKYGPIDLYLYDGDHSYESERKAMTHFLYAMTEIFIVCKDDWQYGDVKRGTLDGLAESGCEILYQRELLNPEPYTEDQHLNDLYWRGFYVALLKKK